jgi:hypothetical protein
MTMVADCPWPAVCAGTGAGVVGVADPVTGTVVCALVAGTGVVLVPVVVGPAGTDDAGEDSSCGCYGESWLEHD